MVATTKTTCTWLARLGCAVLIAVAIPAAATPFVDGEFATYDQNAWGNDPLDGPPASILKARFFDLFTAGAEFGYPFPGGAVMDFSSADAMLTFLPQSGAPATLNSNLTDPTSTSAGVFGGLVVALDLNIGFSDLGELEHPAGVPFGDLVLMGYTGTVAGLNGRTVRELYQIVDAALGGAFEPVSIVDLAGVTNAVNSSFGGGFASDYAQLHYESPAVTAAVPEPSTWLLVLTALGGSGMSGWRRRRVNSERQ
jgi:PEP-CTERM motif